MERIIKTFKASFRAGMVIMLIMAFAFVLCGFIVGSTSTAYAAEIEETETITETENDEQGTETDITDDTTTNDDVQTGDDITTSETESNATFLGRVWEYITEHYTELATTIGDVVLFAVFLINYIKNKKSIASISKDVSFTSSSQSDVVDVVNKLIEGYNTIEEKLNEYNSSEDAKYEAVGSMVVQTKAILEILSRVYANSKNLPQGVKDLVNLTYANAMKATGDTEQLKTEVEEALSEATSTAETSGEATEG